MSGLRSFVTCEGCLENCPTLSADRPEHLMLFRTHVSRTAAGKGRAVLEGVGLKSTTINACFISHPQNEEEAVQLGLTKWTGGQGRQPPTWTMLLEAMEYAQIAQQDVDGLENKLGLSSSKCLHLRAVCALMCVYVCE